MADKDLVFRFQEAFKDLEKLGSENFQKIVEENSLIASGNTERLTFLLLSLVMIFHLILKGSVDKIDIGVVEIGDLSIVLFMFPILVAYTHYDLVITLSKFNRLSIMYKAIIKQCHEPVYKQKITKYFIFPPTLYESRYFSANKIVGVIQRTLWLFQFLSVTVAIPLGFQLYAFGQLCSIAFESDYLVLFSISLVISGLFSIQSLLVIIVLLTGTSE